MTTQNQAPAPIRPNLEHYSYAKKMKAATNLTKFGLSFAPIPFVNWMFGASLISAATAVIPENASWTFSLSGSAVSSALGSNDSVFGIICQLVPFLLQTPYYFHSPNEPTMGQKMTILSHYPTTVDENGDTIPIPLEETQGMKSALSSVWRSEFSSRWDKFFLLPKEFATYFSQNRIIDFIAGPVAQKLWVFPELKNLRQFTPSAISNQIEQKLKEVETKVSSMPTVRKLNENAKLKILHIDNTLGAFRVFKKEIRITPKLIIKTTIVALCIITAAVINLALLPVVLGVYLTLYLLEAKYHFIAKTIMRLLQKAENSIFEHVHENVVHLFDTEEKFYALLNGITDSIQNYLDQNKEFATNPEVQALHQQIKDDIEQYRKLNELYKKQPDEELNAQLAKVKTQLEEHKQQLQDKVIQHVSGGKAENFAMYRSQVKEKLAKALPRILLKNYEKKYPKFAWMMHKIMDEFKRKYPEGGQEALYHFMSDRLLKLLPELSTKESLPEQLQYLLDPLAEITQIDQLENEIAKLQLQAELTKLQNAANPLQQEQMDLLKQHLHELELIEEIAEIKQKAQLTEKDKLRYNELEQETQQFAIFTNYKQNKLETMATLYAEIQALKETIREKATDPSANIQQLLQQLQSKQDILDKLSSFSTDELLKFKQEELREVTHNLTKQSLTQQMEEMAIAQEFLYLSTQTFLEESQQKKLQQLSNQLSNMEFAQEYIYLKVIAEDSLTHEQKLHLNCFEKISQLAMHKAMGSISSGARTLLTAESQQMIHIGLTHSDTITYYVLDKLIDNLEKISEGKLEYTTQGTPLTKMSELVEEMETIEATLMDKQKQYEHFTFGNYGSRPEIRAYYAEKAAEIKREIAVLKDQFEEKKQKLNDYKHNQAYHQYQQLHQQFMQANKELPEIIAKEEKLKQQIQELEMPTKSWTTTVGWGLGKMAEMMHLKAKDKPVNEQLRELEIELITTERKKEQLEGFIAQYPERKKALMQDLQSYEAAFERRAKKLMNSLLDLVAENTHKIIDEQQLPNASQLADTFNGGFDNPEGAGKLKSLFLQMNHQGDWFVNLGFGGLVRLASKAPLIQAGALQLGFKVIKDEVIPQLPIAQIPKTVHKSLRHLSDMHVSPETMQMEKTYRKVQLEAEQLEQQAKQLADKIRQVRDEVPRPSLSLSMQMNLATIQLETTAYDILQVEKREKMQRLQTLQTEDGPNQEVEALITQIHQLEAFLNDYPVSYLQYLELEFRRTVLLMNMKLAALSGTRKRIQEQVHRSA